MVHDVYRYRFSTLVFASWDYHLTDYEATANLRRSIRQQLKEMLNDAADAEVQLSFWARIAGQIRKVPISIVLASVVTWHPMWAHFVRTIQLVAD